MGKKANKILYIISDYTFCAEMLSSLLRASEGIVISGICNDSSQLNKLLELLKVDVVILISCNINFLTICKNKIPDKPILIIGPDEFYEELTRKNKNRQIGPDLQFISLNNTLKGLNEKLSILFNSELVVTLKNDFSFITKREKQILNLISRGKKNKDIAEELFVSVKTIENHRNNILKKTNKESMMTLINELYKIGFLT